MATDAKKSQKGRAITVGVISDTHGYLHPEAGVVFKGADHIIHAGDIVSKDVLSELRTIAPTTAVLGNMDTWAQFDDLFETGIVEIGGVMIYVLHDLQKLDLDLVAAGFAAVVHGHTHRAEIQWHGDVLFLNPGSAGDPRAGRPPTVALLTIRDRQLTPRIIRLS